MSNNCHLLKEKPLVFKWLSSCSPCSLECKDRAGRRCPYIDWVLSPALACLAPRSRCKDQTGQGPYREAPPIKGLNYCDQGGLLHRYIGWPAITLLEVLQACSICQSWKSEQEDRTKQPEMQPSAAITLEVLQCQCSICHLWTSEQKD